MLIQRGKHSNTTNSTVGIRDANLWRSQIWRFFFGPAPLLIEFANAPPLQKISFFDLFSPVSTSILKIIPSNHRPPRPPSVFFPVMPADLPFISRGPYLTGIHRKISGDIRYCFYYVVVPKLHPYPPTFHQSKKQWTRRVTSFNVHC